MKTIKFDAKIFVIPNSAGKIKDFLMSDKYEEIMRKIYELNGKTFNPEKDYLIETWYHSEDLKTDNLPDHGGYYTDQEGNEFYIHVARNRRYLPAVLFDGYREGDTINIKLPMYLSNRNEDYKEEVVADIQMTLDQLNYRYRKFGKFEEVMERVISVAKNF